MPWSLRVADSDYWRDQVRCRAACPVHTDARAYVRAIAEGKDELAYLIARSPNPLAAICGRVCGAPCEVACRRGAVDQPVAIRALKRFACERFGPEARAPADLLAWGSRREGPLEPEGAGELLGLLQAVTRGAVPKVSNGLSVGIVGSGPAGLAAAHDLALLGFAVTLYETETVLGGMLAVGIPEYRLPRALIQAEIAAITAMGVKGVTGCRVGRDISLAELRTRHAAVVLAVGAKRSCALPVPGADASGVMGGIEYLREVSLGIRRELGARVVVIGGGNVAYDVGRTVLRQTSFDAARAARRAGSGQVLLCSLESLAEMPADDAEILEGDEEGIARRNGIGPQEILVDAAGHVEGVRFVRCVRVYDEAHRFAPIYDASDVTEIACDSVLVAIGQSFDLSLLDDGCEDISRTERGSVACDPVTGRTSAGDVFVAGDLAHGPKLLIHAIASGKRVAREIFAHLTGRRIDARHTELRLELPRWSREPGYEQARRQHPRVSPVEARLGGMGREVESGFTEDQARREASRCLDCGVNTIFDGERCILCGGCVDVCPAGCLRILPLEAVPGVAPALVSEGASVILKDETACIRCGLCAERCPTRAVVMERFTQREELVCQSQTA